MKRNFKCALVVACAAVVLIAAGCQSAPKEGKTVTVELPAIRYSDE